MREHDKYLPEPYNRIHELRETHPLIGNFWREQKTAVIFDFDKTISPFYMQRVIFEHLNINERDFWDTCNSCGKLYAEATSMPQNYEFSYLNLLIKFLDRYGISPDDLFRLGKNIKLYPGITEFIMDLIERGVEVYIITSGIRELALNSTLVAEVHNKYPGYFNKRLFGCSLGFEDGKYLIRDIISSHQKPNVIEWVAKGCDILQMEYNPPLNSDYPEDHRIPLDKMIYVGDGPTDIPAFNLVKKNQGFTVGVYNPDEPAQFDQLIKIDKDNRLDLIAKADYTPLSKDNKAKNSYTYHSLYGRIMRVVTLNIKKLEVSNDKSNPIKEQDIKEFQEILTKERSITFVHSWTK